MNTVYETTITDFRNDGFSRCPDMVEFFSKEVLALLTKEATGCVNSSIDFGVIYVDSVYHDIVPNGTSRCILPTLGSAALISRYTVGFRCSYPKRMTDEYRVVIDEWLTVRNGVVLLANTNEVP